MRKTILATSAAVLILASAAGPALAFQQVVGGKAGACSQAARQGRADEAAVDVCTDALASEPDLYADRMQLLTDGSIETVKRSEESHP